MFDLAKRELNPASKATPPQVGPATYDLDQITYDIKHPAPFLRGSKRTSPVAASFTEQIYFPKVPYKVLGGSTPNNRAQRFIFDYDDTPGPGEYDPLLLTKKVRRKAPHEIPVPKHNGKLYLCRVPFSHGVSAPSIPTTIDQNGYKVDNYGELTKNPPDDNDTTLGPCFYDPPKNLTLTEENYRGCCWSKLRAARFGNTVEKSPGPGDYDPEKCYCIPMCADIPFREMKRKYSYLPRYTEIIFNTAKRLDYPAPCEYEVVKPKMFEPSFAPFAVGAKRFSRKNSGGPGPSEYSPDIQLRDRKSFRIGNAPFCSLANRWKSSSAPMPAPNEYKPKNTIEDEITRAVERSKDMKGAFGCNAYRNTLGYLSKNPAPGTYDVKIDFPNPVANNGTYCFESCTTRFSYQCSGTPGPPDYDAITSFKKTSDQKSHHKSELCPFLCSGEQTKSQKSDQKPGPAEYDPAGLSLNKGYHIPKAPRFKPYTSDTPSPDTYTWDFKYGDCLVRSKHTNNSRLAEAVAKRTKTKNHVLPFARMLSMRKKLRAFGHHTN